MRSAGTCSARSGRLIARNPSSSSAAKEGAVSASSAPVMAEFYRCCYGASEERERVPTTPPQSAFFTRS
jgi:hypothetical protein